MGPAFAPGLGLLQVNIYMLTIGNCMEYITFQAFVLSREISKY